MNCIVCSKRAVHSDVTGHFCGSDHADMVRPAYLAYYAGGGKPDDWKWSDERALTVGKARLLMETVEAHG